MLVPPLPYCVELVAGADRSSALRALPSKPGVFALEDDDGHTICIAITADVRRLVRARLAPLEEGAGASRRIDYGALTRTVRATTVGSAFEADWAYLQLARDRLPHTFRTLLDRWRGWFIHANPAASFPRFVKTSAPGSAPTGSEGVYLGPFADKHAAQRAIESLQDLFDLCRYHHILIQAPEGNACAYKEMGKCPAPCDGTVGMDPYRESMQAAIDFAADPAGFEAALQERMDRAAAALDFEGAETLRRRLEALRSFGLPANRFVDRAEGFRYAAVLPAERDGAARLMLIVGGAITPVLDVPIDAPDAALHEAVDAVASRASNADVALHDEAIENIGLVCWHLFRGKRDDGAFLHLRELSAGTLGKALKGLRAAGGDETISDRSLDDG